MESPVYEQPGLGAESQYSGPAIPGIEPPFHAWGGNEGKEPVAS